MPPTWDAAPCPPPCAAPPEYPSHPEPPDHAAPAYRAGRRCLSGAGGYAWTNYGALLVVLSNFIDHTDGELARISGKGSKIGHFYDLASDALITVLLFVSMGMAIGATAPATTEAIGPVGRGTVAGLAVALIFFCACV